MCKASINDVFRVKAEDPSNTQKRQRRAKEPKLLVFATSNKTTVVSTHTHMVQLFPTEKHELRVRRVPMRPPHSTTILPVKFGTSCERRARRAKGLRRRRYRTGSGTCRGYFWSASEASVGKLTPFTQRERCDNGDRRASQARQSAGRRTHWGVCSTACLVEADACRHAVARERPPL